MLPIRNVASRSVRTAAFDQVVTALVHGPRALAISAASVHLRIQEQLEDSDFLPGMERSREDHARDLFPDFKASLEKETGIVAEGDLAEETYSKWVSEASHLVSVYVAAKKERTRILEGFEGPVPYGVEETVKAMKLVMDRKIHAMACMIADCVAEHGKMHKDSDDEEEGEDSESDGEGASDAESDSCSVSSDNGMSVYKAELELGIATREGYMPIDALEVQDLMNDVQDMRDTLDELNAIGHEIAAGSK